MGRFEKEWTKSKLDLPSISTGPYEVRRCRYLTLYGTRGVENVQLQPGNRILTPLVGQPWLVSLEIAESLCEAAGRVQSKLRQQH